MGIMDKESVKGCVSDRTCTTCLYFKESEFAGTCIRPDLTVCNVGSNDFWESNEFLKESERIANRNW